VRLTIAIPEARLLEAPAVLRLIRMAQSSDMEADDQGPAYVACFEDLPQSVDVIAQLIWESADPNGIRISIDGRSIASPVKFYNALLCYRESLGAPDAAAYCAQRAERVGDAGECPDRMCLSHCQFMCSRCVGLARERGAPPISVQLQGQGIARQAEVDWCPNLRIAKLDA
jgi:hypothetical protein